MRPRACPRRPASPWTGIRKLIALAMIAQQITPLASATPLNKSGKWVTTPSELGFSGTHVAVLRRPGTDSTTVFVFGESGTPQTLKFWRWVPKDTVPQAPALDVMLDLPHPNNRASDLFCSGHATLPDGKMLLVGGAWTPDTVCQNVYTLDPAWNGASGSPWTQSATMAVWWCCREARSDILSGVLPAAPATGAVRSAHDPLGGE